MLEICKPSFQRVDHRGTLVEILNLGRWESVLWGEMRAEAMLGNHYHKRTEVFLFLLSGRAEVVCVHTGTGERIALALETQEGALLKTLVAHAVRFQKDSAFLMLKSLPYDPADPDTFPYPVL